MKKFFLLISLVSLFSLTGTTYLSLEANSVKKQVLQSTDKIKLVEYQTEFNITAVKGFDFIPSRNQTVLIATIESQAAAIKTGDIRIFINSRNTYPVPKKNQEISEAERKYRSKYIEYLNQVFSEMEAGKSRVFIKNPILSLLLNEPDLNKAVGIAFTDDLYINETSLKEYIGANLYNLKEPKKSFKEYLRSQKSDEVKTLINMQRGFNKVEILDLKAHKYPIYKSVQDYNKQPKKYSEELYTAEFDLDKKYQINFENKLRDADIKAINKTKSIDIKVTNPAHKVCEFKGAKSQIADLKLQLSQNSQPEKASIKVDVRDVFLVGSSKKVSENNLYLVLSKYENESNEYYLAEFPKGEAVEEFLQKLNLKPGQTTYIKKEFTSKVMEIFTNENQSLKVMSKIHGTKNIAKPISMEELKASIAQSMGLSAIFSR